MADVTGRVLSPEDLRAMLRDGDEIALLDVREEGVFSEDGHPFFANSVPLSRLELMIRDQVPRKSARIVVLDGGEEGLAERAAAKLDRIGYDNVAVMAGGSKAWAAAGFELVTGVMNIQYYYAWPFVFYQAHYYGAWVFIAAFVAAIAGVLVNALVRGRTSTIALAIAGLATGGIITLAAR